MNLLSRLSVWFWGELFMHSNRPLGFHLHGTPFGRRLTRWFYERFLAARHLR